MSPTSRRALVAQLRQAMPDPLLERANLQLARRLEVRLRRRSEIRGAALVFHSVAPRAGDPDLEIDPPVAARQLDGVVGYLKRRYALVGARELPGAARRRRAGEPIPVAVTFDDDLPSHLEHAAPILARHGVPAAAFLCGARSAFWWQLLQVAVDAAAIGSRDLAPVPAELVAAALARQPRAIGRLAHAIEELSPEEREGVVAVLRRALTAPPPVLGPDGAAALAAAGWEIGFHTRRHDALTRLDDEALRQALEEGREELPGAAPATVAYPHGKATAREAAAARAAGYLAAFTGRAEVFTERTDVHLIGRLQPPTATVGVFALRLARALSAG